ncbi:MAG: tetratricopeptide repeat protein [Planctomycetota bacterium]|nr:tetratricopeptide repeat protein [Planctomycetota bacterium]
MAQKDTDKTTVQEKKFWRAERFFYVMVAICAAFSIFFVALLIYLLREKGDYPEPYFLILFFIVPTVIAGGTWFYVSFWQERRYRNLKELFLKLRHTDEDAAKIVEEAEEISKERRARRVQCLESTTLIAGILAIAILASAGVVSVCVNNASDTPMGVFAVLIATMTAVFVVFGFIMYGRSREMREELKEVRREAVLTSAKLKRETDSYREELGKKQREFIEKSKTDLAGEMDNFKEDLRRKTDQEIKSLTQKAELAELAQLNYQRVQPPTSYSDEFKKGIAALNRSDYYTAIAHFSNAIENTPSSAAYLNRGNAKFELGRHEEAIKDYDEAIRLDPKYAAAYNNRGAANVKLGRHKDALSDYDEAIKLDPKYALAYRNRGNAKFELDRYEEAIKDYDEAIKLDPKYSSAYNNRGNAKLELGRHEEAIKDYDEAIKLDSKNAYAYNNRGAAKAALGRHEEAIKDYEEAIKLDRKYAFAYNNRGNAKLELGRHEESIKDYDEAIKLDPKYADAYNNRGAANVKLGRHEEAIKDYDDAIKLDPKYALAYRNRGYAEAALGRYEEAIKDYEEAIKLNPDEAFYYNNRGNAKASLGRHEEAIKDFDDAIKLKPEKASYYNNRGIAKFELGRHEEAIKDYDEAIRLDPKYADACSNRGAALLKLVDQKPQSEHAKLLEKAEKMCARARELSDNQKGLYNSACVAARLGKEDECEKWLEMSIGKDCPPREHVEKDPDLESMRDMQWFKELLEKME